MQFLSHTAPTRDRFQCLTRRGLLPLLALAVALTLLGRVPVQAQGSPAPKTGNKTASEKDEKKIPEPEDLTLTTSDGVRLALTYYPSTQGAEAVPVLMLHMYQRNRADYKELAERLQAKGFAVIIPDLRGHGASTKQKVGGEEYILNAAKMPNEQFRLMVENDLYAVKEFLWEKNNAKNLNLNKLCIIGAEMGASVAMNFTAFDATGYGESDRGPYYGRLQLGLFVKALILLSPNVSFKGLSPTLPQHQEIRKNIPVLILVGKGDSKALDEARRVSKLFTRLPPKNPEDTTYFFNPLDTNLQGTKLLEPKSLSAEKMISQFLKLRLVDSDQARDWTWKKLEKPF